MDAPSDDDDPMLISGPDHPCPYLVGNVARFSYARRLPPGENGFEQLLDAGFRRSGLYVYRTDCSGCEACIPLRVSTDFWVPDRSQTRAMRKNSDVELRIGNPEFNEERHDLFARYLATRHDGQMSSDYNELAQGLYRSPVATVEITGRMDGKLVSAGIVDVGPNLWSLVYSAWDPDLASRSLGTAYVCWALLFARNLGVPWVHLGYWIQGSRTMEYKARFRPHELYRRDKGWTRVTP